ncbi:hypothetical protein SVAN01_10680 [Stagonosporopsis vannaccii]|nr:hypothetical protein SVAN01_10680 [Stagonosporopsis vannaccii]
MGRTRRTEPVPQALDPLPTGTCSLLRHGDNAVAYHIPTAPSSDATTPLKTTIALPRRSDWTSGLHFHATHTEYLRLLKGAIFVQLNGQMKLISAVKGGEIDRNTGQLAQEGLVIEVPRYARHNWGRLEHYIYSPSVFKQGRGLNTQELWPEDWTDEVVVEEWTEPNDIQKPLFFWNLNGIITGSSEATLNRRQQAAKMLLGHFWIDLQLFGVFWELDNWPVFFDLREMPFGGSRGFLPRLTDHAEVVISVVVLLLAQIIGLLLGLHAVEQRRTPDALWRAYLRPAHIL